MSTHNICFHGGIKKILYGYPLLSVANPLLSVAMREVLMGWSGGAKVSCILRHRASN